MWASRVVKDIAILSKMLNPLMVEVTTQVNENIARLGGVSISKKDVK